MADATSMSVKACIFDAYGTLFDVRTGIAALCREALGEQAERFAETWRSRQVQYSWLRTIMGRHTDFAAITAEALDYTMSSLGLDDPGLRRRLLDHYRTPPLHGDVPAVLAELAAHGVRLAILSNGTQDMLDQVVADSGIAARFERVLSVEAVGAYKPDPRAYALAAARLGVAPQETAFVSSNSWDAHGAATFGFHTVWVNRKEAQDERLPGSILHIIPSLTPLPALLGRAP